MDWFKIYIALNIVTRNCAHALKLMRDKSFLLWKSQ